MSDPQDVSAVLMAKPRREFRIELGAMAPSLKDQLRGTIIPQHELQAFDQLAGAITTLRFGGRLTYAETNRARDRLVKNLFKRAEELRQAATKGVASHGA
jgi:hypothetical protein